MSTTALVAAASLASLTVMGCFCGLIHLAEQGSPWPFSRLWWRRLAV